MHFIIDAVGTKHSGGGIVLQHFLAQCLQDIRFSRVSIFVSPRTTRHFDLPQASHLIEIERPAEEHSRWKRYLWYEHTLEQECRILGADLVLCSANTGRISSLPNALFIQQSLVFSAEAVRTLPARRKFEIAAIGMIMGRSCAVADLVFVQSQVMATLVHERFKVPYTKLSVHVPNVEELPNVIKPSSALDIMRATSPDRRLLYVGNISQYKNIDILVKAMPLLREKLPGAALYLTIPKDHSYGQIEGIYCLGYLNRSEVREAYELASVLTLPSLTETVGLPMLEALLHGTPVLAADRPYAHEMCEGGALYFDPKSLGEFVRQAVIILTDQGVRERCIMEGKLLLQRRKQENPYGEMVNRVAALKCL